MRKGKGFTAVMRDRALGRWMTSWTVIALDSQARGHIHILLAGVFLGRLHGLGLMLVLKQGAWPSCIVGPQQSCLLPGCCIMADPADKLVYAKK